MAPNVSDTPCSNSASTAVWTAARCFFYLRSFSPANSKYRTHRKSTTMISRHSTYRKLLQTNGTGSWYVGVWGRGRERLGWYVYPGRDKESMHAWDEHSMSSGVNSWSIPADFHTATNTLPHELYSLAERAERCLNQL